MERRPPRGAEPFRHTTALRHDGRAPLRGQRLVYLGTVEEGKATSVAGNDVQVRADSVCVHSDTPNAVDIAKAVKQALAPFMGRPA